MLPLPESESESESESEAEAEAEAGAARPMHRSHHRSWSELLKCTFRDRRREVLRLRRKAEARALRRARRDAPRLLGEPIVAEPHLYDAVNAYNDSPLSDLPAAAPVPPASSGTAGAH